VNYVTCRLHRMKKDKFGVTCPGALVMESLPAHPSMKNSVSSFHGPDAQNAVRDPQIPPVVKTQVWVNMSRGAYCQICICPTRA
jgi:hypothetical protein